MSWKKISKNPYISLLRTAWKYARGERKKYLLIYGLFVGSHLAVSLFPIIWGLFINELQQDGMNALKAVWVYAGAYLLLHFIDWCFHGPARVMERKLAFSLGRNFLNEMYHKAIHLPVKWHQDNHSGATINRIRKAHEALFEFFDSGFMYFQSVTKFIFAISAIVYFSPIFGSISILLGFVVVYIIIRFDKPFIEATREVNEREHIVSSTLFDSLSNIITVITLRLEKRMEKGLDKNILNIVPPFKRKVLVNEWKWFTVSICIALIYGIIVIGYVWQNYSPGEIFLIGGLVTLMGYVEQFSGVFVNIAWQYTAVVKYNTDVQTVNNITEAYDKQHLPDLEENLPRHWEDLKIKELSYFHQEPLSGSDRIQGLNKVTIQVPKGKKVALIGESGSGKSTLLALMRGLYPSDGEELIEIDGVTSNGLDLIGNHVTLFPQEPEIFENSIEYNITLGLNFPEEEIMEVCKTAHFDEVVRQLPKGLASGIQEKGVNLSGGQKQRLALARGILAARDSDIVLLDEPTSSVDPKTEIEIYQKLFKAFHNKAVVSSLHRLHLLSHFDYVYVMDNGRIVAEGTFDYLRENSPDFQELWKHQEESYQEMNKLNN